MDKNLFSLYDGRNKNNINQNLKNETDSFLSRINYIRQEYRKDGALDTASRDALIKYITEGLI